ncbi:MAG TPA: lysophospholipid acyltransferase family protein [Rhizomicrobium sp.]
MNDAALTSSNFSYAGADDPWLKRTLIRAIERATGQPYLKRLYEQYLAERTTRAAFWDEAFVRLNLKLDCDFTPLDTWPRKGPLVVVANHPYGVLDGIVICHIVARVRGDFLVLTHELLTRTEELRPYLLPVDFSETDDALHTNLKSRAAAKHHLMNGGCLIVFPAGGVSTTPSIWHSRATDAKWKNLTGRLIAQSRATVAPVYFDGQNSRAFQIASHISATLRLSLLFKEVRDRIGTTLRVRLGNAVPYAQLAAIGDRAAIMQHLREMTYALADT